METKDLILIEQFCAWHNAELSFIDSLNELGLIEIIALENGKYLIYDQLKDLEKMIEFHYELKINIEGIDAIYNLLQQVDILQKELIVTKNKLHFFEKDLKI